LELIGNDSTRCVTQSFQQVTKVAFSRPFVTVFLHADIQYITILINSAPKIMALATNRHRYLIEKPRVTGARLSASNFHSILVTELETPLPHSFIGDDNAACSQ
jgi:hypothetical protein